MIPSRQTAGYSLQASKWQKCPILIDPEEMRDLFQTLGDFYIVQISGVLPLGEELVEKKDFQEIYSQYIEGLKQGMLPTDPRTRSYFSSVFTLDLNALYRVKVNDTSSLVKVVQPVIQLQAHRFDYFPADGSFRSMVMRADSISWGLQFSFPHLFQDENFIVHTVREEQKFPNTALFKKLQGWVRSHTLATPLEIEGKITNVPIRLGKQCLPWINHHPQLLAKGLKVKNG